MFYLQKVMQGLEKLGYECYCHVTVDKVMLYVSRQNLDMGSDAMVFASQHDFMYLKTTNMHGWTWQVFLYNIEGTKLAQIADMTLAMSENFKTT